MRNRKEHYSHILVDRVGNIPRPHRLDRADAAVCANIPAESTASHNFAQAVNVCAFGQRRGQLKVLVFEHQGEGVESGGVVRGDDRSDRCLGKRGNSGVEQRLRIGLVATRDPEGEGRRLVVEHEVRRVLVDGRGRRGE